jgi:hypothetical protein
LIAGERNARKRCFMRVVRAELRAVWPRLADAVAAGVIVVRTDALELLGPVASPVVVLASSRKTNRRRLAPSAKMNFFSTLCRPRASNVKL